MSNKDLILFLFFLLSLSVTAQPPVADAGPFQKSCPPAVAVNLGGNPTASGGVPGYTYNWQPTTGMSNNTVANPVVQVTVTTTFTVTVTGANGETGKDTVTIYIYNFSINAGPDTTILQGQTITLHGSATGNPTQVNWMPSVGHIYNQNSLNPDVFPPSTTTYTFSAVYPGGCILYDYATVIVKPTDQLFFFNTMTPNGDGVNDFFYVGNIEKYPDNVLEIYNRYGQKVYSKTGYQNDWNGMYLNAELPSGTYFYILDTKTDKGGKFHGQITIIR